MKFKYKNKNLQNDLVSHLKKRKNLKFRIKRDKTIESANKWKPYIENLTAQIANEILSNPIIEEWDMRDDYIYYIHKLAEHNILFLIEQWDEQIKIVTQDRDTEQIFEIKQEIKKL